MLILIFIQYKQVFPGNNKIKLTLASFTQNY